MSAKIRITYDVLERCLHDYLFLLSNLKIHPIQNATPMAKNLVDTYIKDAKMYRSLAIKLAKKLSSTKDPSLFSIDLQFHGLKNRIL